MTDENLVSHSKRPPEKYCRPVKINCMCMYEFMQKLFNLNRDLDNDASFIKTNVLI